MTGRLCDWEGVVMQCDEDDKEKERKGKETSERCEMHEMRWWFLLAPFA